MTNSNPTSKPVVFRSIEIGTGVSVTLGEPLSAEAMGLMIQIGPQHFRVKPGAFGDAKQIDIFLGVGGAVQKMDFLYAAGTNYEEMVANFEGQMGPPTSQHGGVTEWKDDSTDFTLVNSASGIHSTLRDLAPTA